MLLSESAPDNDGCDTLRHLIVLLLTTACAETPAQLASASAPLPREKPARFSAARFPDPEVDNSKTAAELTKMGSGGADSKGGGVQLGHVMVETKLAVIPQTNCQGLVVRLDFI